MKIFRLIIPILAGLLMAFATVVVFAGSREAPANPAQPMPAMALAATPTPQPNVSETNLLPRGLAESIHADATGKLWINEGATGTVREFDPTTHAYTLYTGLTETVDAQLGPVGKLWWIGGARRQELVRMDLGTRLVTTWPLSVTGGLDALAFDANQRVWTASFAAPGLYRFDAGTNQACDVDLSDGGATHTIVPYNGGLWVGDALNHRVGRITPATNAYTYWPLNFGGGFPELESFTFDPNGNVWWADGGLGKIGWLEPNTNHLMLFGPPGLSSPRQVAYYAGKVWFTDPFTASLGFVDPEVAVGQGPYVVTPTTTALTPDCSTAAPGPSFTAGISTGVASFIPQPLLSIVNSEGTLYKALASGEPWGLAFVGFDLYATDISRDKLMHIDTAAAHLYLPAVAK